MPNTCSNCSYSRTMDNRYVCCATPPTSWSRSSIVARFPVVDDDWWCGCHSAESGPYTRLSQQPIAVSVTNGLRANLGTLSAVAGSISIPATGGVKQYDYYRVIVGGTLFGLTRAVGDLVAATKDSPSPSTAGDWLIL